VTYTARAENNNKFFRDILHLYVREYSAVADLTWGRGKFWEGIDRDKYKLIRLDKHTPCDVRADFRAVPLADGSQDAVVFDPPYVTRMGFKRRSKENPNGSNQKSAFGLDEGGPKNEREIDALYADGTAESHRILKRGGILILKTMDTQRWRHIELANLPGFKLIDLFVVVTKGLPPGKPYSQKHARKNHSYFMVFRKVRKRV
jgi:tRNA G10  N-methylase Trm11